MKKSDLKDGEKVNAWITKYALTVGIYEDLVEVCEGGAQPFAKGRTYYHGNDWHLTEFQARTRGLEMIATKRKSLQNTLKKLAELEKEWG